MEPEICISNKIRSSSALSSTSEDGAARCLEFGSGKSSAVVTRKRTRSKLDHAFSITPVKCCSSPSCPAAKICGSSFLPKQDSFCSTPIKCSAFFHNSRESPAAKSHCPGQSDKYHFLQQVTANGCENKENMLLQTKCSISRKKAVSITSTLALRENSQSPGNCNSLQSSPDCPQPQIKSGKAAGDYLTHKPSLSSIENLKNIYMSEEIKSEPCSLSSHNSANDNPCSLNEDALPSDISFSAARDVNAQSTPLSSIRASRNAGQGNCSILHSSPIIEFHSESGKWDSEVCKINFSDFEDSCVHITSSRKAIPIPTGFGTGASDSQTDGSGLENSFHRLSFDQWLQKEAEEKTLVELVTSKVNNMSFERERTLCASTDVDGRNDKLPLGSVSHSELPKEADKELEDGEIDTDTDFIVQDPYVLSLLEESLKSDQSGLQLPEIAPVTDCAKTLSKHAKTHGNAKGNSLEEGEICDDSDETLNAISVPENCGTREEMKLSVKNSSDVQCKTLNLVEETEKFVKELHNSNEHSKTSGVSERSCKVQMPAANVACRKDYLSPEKNLNVVRSGKSVRTGYNQHQHSFQSEETAKLQNSSSYKNSETLRAKETSADILTPVTNCSKVLSDKLVQEKISNIPLLIEDQGTLILEESYSDTLIHDSDSCVNVVEVTSSPRADIPMPKEDIQKSQALNEVSDVAVRDGVSVDVIILSVDVSDFSLLKDSIADETRNISCVSQPKMVSDNSTKEIPCVSSPKVLSVASCKENVGIYHPKKNFDACPRENVSKDKTGFKSSGSSVPYQVEGVLSEETSLYQEGNITPKGSSQDKGSAKVMEEDSCSQDVVDLVSDEDICNEKYSTTETKVLKHCIETDGNNASEKPLTGFTTEDKCSVPSCDSDKSRAVKKKRHIMRNNFVYPHEDEKVGGKELGDKVDGCCGSEDDKSETQSAFAGAEKDETKLSDISNKVQSVDETKKSVTKVESVVTVPASDDKENLPQKSSENEVKKREPFKSSDPQENLDINHPDWDKIKKLETDEERYKQVRACWKSKHVPDPNRNLTCHSFRKKRLAKDNHAKKVKEPKQHKRTASENIDPRETKRMRTKSVPCTQTIDTHIQSVKKKFKEAERNAREEYESEMYALRNQQNRFEGNFSGESRSMHGYNFHPFYDSYVRAMRSSSVSVIQRHHENQIIDLEDKYNRILSSIENSYSSKINVLTEARKEINKFCNFYKGLNDIESDPTILTQPQLEELHQIDTVYEQFQEHYYDPNEQ